MNLSQTNTSKNFNNRVKTSSNCETNLSSEYSAMVQCSIACCTSKYSLKDDKQHMPFFALPSKRKEIKHSDKKAYRNSLNRIINA